ncbi:MAG: NAD(P)H-hydrate dehydratase [Clostridiales bacterium]|nr:NAD(P)H-hydrate dehydratase [Clostridiales bacterium]
MQRILSVEQMRKADEYTIKTLGVPSEALIERAGEALANEITKRYMGGRVLFVVGKGNNGQDGVVASQILSQKHGFKVSVCEVYKGDLTLLENRYDIIVDCIFGTGLNKTVEGVYKTAIELINNNRARVISCDIPSGLNGDSGLVMGVAVKANLTVAIQELKTGHFLNDGYDYCGEIVCKDIGISVWEEDFCKRFEKRDLKRFFPPRNRNVHKGSFGKVSVIGGSKKYSGSVLLSYSALTALKMGVGYSNLAVPNSLINAYIGINPECTFTPIKDEDGEMLFDKTALDSLMQYNSIAVGMGIGQTYAVYEILSYLIKNFTGKLIIDADGLNVLSKYGVDILSEKSCTVILTPHIGEFSRLTNIEKTEIVSNTIKHAVNFAKKYDVILLVKSAVSVITDGKQVYINTTGSSCMAKGGSGDLLSGLILGLTARSTEPVLENVVGATNIFGLSGELCEKEHNAYTPTPSDVAKNIERIIDGVDSL